MQYYRNVGFTIRKNEKQNNQKPITMTTLEIILAIVLSIAATVITTLFLISKRKLESSSYKAARALNALGLFKLKKDDFKNIYTHALITYDQTPKTRQWVILLFRFEVFQAYQDAFYSNDYSQVTEQAQKSLTENYREDTQLEILLRDQKVDASKIQTEINRFHPIFLQKVNATKSAQEIKRDLEIAEMRKEQLKKTYDYQIREYCKGRIKDWDFFLKTKGPYMEARGEEREYMIEDYFKKNFTNVFLYNMGKYKDKDIAEEKTLNFFTQKINLKDEKNNHLVLSKQVMSHYLQKWLQDSTSNLLIIIGEYGTGKTTFSRYLTQQLCLKYLKSYEQTENQQTESPIVPLYLPLRRFTGELSPFVTDLCTNEYGIKDTDYQQIKERVNKNELLIIYDGFDEMLIKEIDSDQKQKNFDKLRALITPNAKVILTCREEFFHTVREMFNTFSKEEGKETYQYRYLHYFTPEQITEYLQIRDPQNADRYSEVIQRTEGLQDLAKRPVLLELIVKHLPQLLKGKKEGEKITASDLYQSCIKGEIRRKKNLTPLIHDQQRLQILQKIALWLYHNGAALSFNIREPFHKVHLQQYFKPNAELEPWEYQKHLNAFITFTFLIRESDHQFRISHKSFRDYLIAQALVEQINGTQLNTDFGKSQLSNEIQSFILEQNPSKEKLLELVLTAKNLTENQQWQGTNAANLLLQLDSNAFEGHYILGCNLSNIDFRYASLKATKFQDCILKNCIFSENIMIETSVSNSDFTNSELFAKEYWINDKDMKALSNLTNLRLLDISKNRAKNYNSLEKLERLEELWISISQFSDLQPISKLTQLLVLGISKNNIIDLRPIKNLKLLKLLNISMNPITDLSPISNLTQLQSLNISNTHITSIEPISNLIQMKFLNIYNTKILNLRPISKMTNLVTLQISKTQVSNLKSLKNLTNLEELSMYKTKTNNLSPIYNLNHLKKLDISDTQVKELEPIKNLIHLEILYADNTPINNLEFISSLTKLNELSIFNTQVKSLKPLYFLKKLTYLRVKKDHFSPDHLELLKKALPKLEIYIEELNNDNLFV